MDSTYVEAVLLGIVQGIAEFLPISSSGHLIITSWILEGKPLPLTLNIALHVGTLAALLIYFWRDWMRLTKAAVRRVAKGERSHEADVLLPGLVIGTIPAGILGALFEKKIEALFHNPVSVAIPLAIVGVVIWLGDKQAPASRDTDSITIKDALIIGCAQACALIPGVSRSGSTMLAGRLRHFTRTDAARFAFLLGTPITAGAVVLKSKAILGSIGEPLFYVGILTSFVTGCLTISFLLKFLKKFGFGIFAIYRVALAGVILLMTMR